jgi:hypothetical protein
MARSSEWAKNSSGRRRDETDALEDEHFNRLPDQFSPFIAEQLLNLPVHQEDGTASSTISILLGDDSTTS